MNSASFAHLRLLCKNWLLRLPDNPLWSVLQRALPTSMHQRLREIFHRSVREDFRFTRTASWTSASAAIEAPIATTKAAAFQDPIGINLLGYFSRWMGLGECARLFARSMLMAELPVALRDIDVSIPHESLDHSLDAHFCPDRPFAYDLVFVNPDHWPEMLAQLGPRERNGHYVIAYWFWELETFPAAWLPVIEQVDEIMVCNDFVLQSIRKVSHKPVTKIPPPLLPGACSGLQRMHFGLDDADYVFVTAFDFNSTLTRKNPHAAIEAFLRAFPAGDEKARLLLKSSNGQRHLRELMALAAAASRDPRILLRDDLLEDHDMRALYRCCDVIVSLHRSEGFGLVVAEAMRMGKPVIATGYSGNMEFMTRDNSCPVGYRMVPVNQGEYPLGAGQYWAEPDIDEAAHYMRSLHTDRALGQRLAAQAMADIAARYTPEVCLQQLQERLRQIAYSRGIRSNADAPSTDNE